MGDHGAVVWVSFNVFVVFLLALDLGVFHRKERAIGVREALAWTAFWVALSLAFNLLILFQGAELGLLARGPSGEPLSETRTAIDFFTAYLLEKSLSVDNIFVFLLVFKYFAVPAQHQHKVLFWGILGALVMRLGFILAGVALLERFHAVAYLFGAILLFTGFKLWVHGDTDVKPERNIVLRLFRKFVPVENDPEDGRLVFRRPDGGWVATPLLVALVVIETTDVLFAIDSVPAVLSVTSDAFIAYSSNVFAILGLRALYFALAGVMPLFKDLHYGLSFILIFVGGKMIVGELIELPESMHWISLGVIGGALALAMITSISRHKKEIAAVINADQSVAIPHDDG